MTQAIAKYAAKKMLAGEMNKYKSKEAESPYDPFYEMKPHPKKPGKFKKMKKQIPAYIPPHEADILARARKTAYKLDFCLFNFLGLRFGWSSVIALVPAIGDFLDFLLAVFLVIRMNKIDGGLPRKMIGKMALTIFYDFAVGLIPFVGDLADAAVKCNSWNVRRFEKYLDKRYKPRELVEADNKKPKDRQPRPATVYEDFSDVEDFGREKYDTTHDAVRQPNLAYSPIRSTRPRVPDEEMGIPRPDTQRPTR